MGAAGGERVRGPESSLSKNSHLKAMDSLESVRSTYELPMMEVVEKSHQVHRTHFDQNVIQRV